MKRMDLNIKAVIFDMDGVITNTMPDHYRAWRQALRERGVHVSHYDIYGREGQRGLNSVQELFYKYQVPYKESEARKILLRKEMLFKKIAKTRFITGSRAFIKKLHKQDFKLALVTGTSRHETHKILPKHIFDCFSVVVTGSDVKNGKPHPEPFTKAVCELNIQPNEAVVIENAPFGIQSATEAGLNTIALETSLPKKYLKGAMAVFSNIKEMTTAINFNLN